MKPSYLTLYENGQLRQRIEKAKEIMRCCTICPKNCRVDRISGNLGGCGVGRLAPVSSYGPHFGEERPLVGQHGSGTLFFASCNLLCIFCQNYEISRFAERDAEHLNSKELAAVMIHLQEQGCHNINLVTPTHVAAHILEALPEAIEYGLRLPLVYNSSGYDSVATLDLLDGIIDIYMPDFKFWENTTAKLYTNAADYGDVARKALVTMFRQVGDLVLDESGLAQRGLLIRHLVMPEHVEETGEILNYIAEKISPNCHVNIMDQYRPCGEAISPIDRGLRGSEYEEALGFAQPTRLVQLNETRLADLLKNLGIL